jgi:hypothetical protein
MKRAGGREEGPEAPENLNFRFPSRIFWSKFMKIFRFLVRDFWMKWKLIFR